MAVSNNLIALLNFLALLCSSTVIGAGVWLAMRSNNECFRASRWPVFILDALLLFVSLAGFVDAYWGRRRLLAAYLLAMAALIVALLVVLVLTFVVTRPDGSHEVPDRAYREYRLQGYSEWLRDKVRGSVKWRVSLPRGVAPVREAWGEGVSGGGRDRECFNYGHGNTGCGYSTKLPVPVA